MKQETLLNAMEQIRDEYLESAVKSMRIDRRKSPFRTIAVSAACITLCIGILVTSLLLTPASLPITEHRIVSSNINGPIRIENGTRSLLNASFGGKYAGLFDPAAASCRWYLSAEAGVSALLPDIYEEIKNGERYRILKLSIHEALSCKNLPETIYFRVSEALAEALAMSDRLIVDLRQLGVERYPMRNTESGCMETFSLIFESADCDPIIFVQKENGLYTESTELFPQGSSLQEVKSKIRSEREGNGIPDARVYTSADFRCDETKAIFAYMASVTDGVFVQRVSADGYGGRHIVFTRYLNGFETPEEIEIFLSGNGNVTLEHKPYKLTEQEIANAPALAPVIRKLTEETIAPPHTTSPMETVWFSVTGWYDKKTSDGEMYAVIKLLWHLSDGRCLYFDDMYLIVNGNGSYQIAERDDLKALIGSSKHIENLPYNEPLLFLFSENKPMPIAHD